MTSDTERPLDHATARIVAELASALLPRLQETLAAELKNAVEALSVQAGRGVEETLTALQRLKAASDGIVTSLDTAGTSIKAMSLDVLSRIDMLSRIGDQLESFTVQPSAETLDTLKNAIAHWEGVLKADAHAQTRELSEFSSELLELIRGMEGSLPQMVKDVVEKVTVQNGEWMKIVLENRNIIEKRLARLEKIVVVSGATSVIFLAVAALILYR